MVISTIVLLFILIFGIFSQNISQFPFDAQNINSQLQTSSWTHWMGTDSLGRDLFSRVLYGAKVSMFVGLFSAVVSILIGTFIGAISGYNGGWVDFLLMRIVDFSTIFPNILIAILLMLFLGNGLLGIIISISCVSWVQSARLVRAQVLQIKNQMHIESATATGASARRIILKHIMPLVMGPLLVSLTYQIPSNIMAESFLSFLGIGIQPPYASWGSLANEGFRAMRSYPHLMIYPGGILFITMIAFQYLGDGLHAMLLPMQNKDSII